MALIPRLVHCVPRLFSASRQDSHTLSSYGLKDGDFVHAAISEEVAPSCFCSRPCPYPCTAAVHFAAGGAHGSGELRLCAKRGWCRGLAQPRMFLCPLGAGTVETRPQDVPRPLMHPLGCGQVPPAPDVAIDMDRRDRDEEDSVRGFDRLYYAHPHPPHLSTSLHTSRTMVSSDKLGVWMAVCEQGFRRRKLTFSEHSSTRVGMAGDPCRTWNLSSWRRSGWNKTRATGRPWGWGGGQCATGRDD